MGEGDASAEASSPRRQCEERMRNSLTRNVFVKFMIENIEKVG